MLLTIFSLLFPFYAQEQIAPVALYRRATGAIRSQSLLEKTESLFRSFAHKKRATRMKTKECIPNPGDNN